MKVKLLTVGIKMFLLECPALYKIEVLLFLVVTADIEVFQWFPAEAQHSWERGALRTAGVT